MSKINKVFEKLQSKNQGALIAYLMGGDPDSKTTIKIAEALIKGGIDILELGIPFSDPIADGPTIQHASTRALNAGTTPKTVLEIAKELKSKYDIPIAIMTYYNLLFKMGLENFFKQAQKNNIDATIIPDLPLEEAMDYKKAADKFCIDTIFLVSPSTTENRLNKMIQASSGFLYLVSHFGVTGTKSKVESETLNLVKKTKTFTTGKNPLAVGFGVSKPEHVKDILNAGADGVIVGSAFINIISANLSDPKKMLKEIEETAKKLKQATIKQ